MKSLRTIIALAMMVPLASPAALFDSTADDPTVLPASEGSTVATETTTAYKCCWVWMLGQWWCIPC